MEKEQSKYETFTLYKGKVIVKFYPASHQYWISKNGGKNFKRAGGSVTSIIDIKDKSDGLVPWSCGLAEDYLLSKKNVTQEDIYIACSLHEEKKREAADIGSKIHEWCDNYIQGKKPPMPEEKEVQIGVTAFLEWSKKHKVEYISSERAIYSLKHDFVGKMDLEAKIDKKRVLVDFKSSNDLHNDYYMQTAAYLKADEEESGKKYGGRWLIRFAKETEKEYIARMEKKNRKREIKGKEPVEYPKYQVFEAMFLNNDTLERDFKAFLACKVVKDFEKETGYYAKLK